MKTLVLILLTSLLSNCLRAQDTLNRKPTPANFFEIKEAKKTDFLMLVTDLDEFEIQDTIGTIKYLYKAFLRLNKRLEAADRVFDLMTIEGSVRNKNKFRKAIINYLIIKNEK